MNKDLTATTSIELNAPPAKVWAAVTQPEMVKQYFFGTDLDTNWEVGGPIIFRGEWEGQSYEDKGTVLKFEPERLLEFNYWSNFSGTEDVPENYAVITYELTPKDGKTVLSITQTGFESEEKKDHSDENWNNVLKGLKDLVEKAD